MLDELHRDRPDDTEVLTLRGIVYRERGPVRRRRGRSEGRAQAGARLGGCARGAGHPVRRPDAVRGRGGAPRGRQARAQQPRLSEQPRLLAVPAPALQGGDHRLRVGGAAGAAVARACARTWASPARRWATCGARRASSRWAAPRPRRRTTSASRTSGAATWRTPTISTSRRSGSIRRRSARVRIWSTPPSCSAGRFRPRRRRGPGRDRAAVSIPHVGERRHRRADVQRPAIAEGCPC